MVKTEKISELYKRFGMTELSEEADKAQPTDALGHIYAEEFNEQKSLRLCRESPRPEDLLEYTEPKKELTADEIVKRLDPTCDSASGGIKTMAGITKIGSLAVLLGYSNRQTQKIIFSRRDASFIHCISSHDGCTRPQSVSCALKYVAVYSNLNSLAAYGTSLRNIIRQEKRNKVPGWTNISGGSSIKNE